MRILFRSRLLVFCLLILLTELKAADIFPDSAKEIPGGSHWGKQFADMILTHWPDPMSIDPNRNGWEYNTGIVLFGMSKIYEKSRDPRYLNYIRHWVDSYVDEKGNLKWEQERAHNLDYIQPAILILFLYEQTGESKYQLAARKVRESLESVPRNPEGGFWHKGIYPNEMWVDGIYMAEPFLVRYGKLFGDAAFCNDMAVFQTALVSCHAYDSRNQMLYHAWDQDRNAEWADPQTGLSSQFWSRGMGWYVMALVDILEILPAQHLGRATLQILLKDVVEGLKRTQDPKTGLWFQVLDKGNKPGNWIEVSGSAMYIYAVKKALRLHLIEPHYNELVVNAWKGLPSFFETDDQGMPVVTSVVRGMGVQKDFQGYIQVPRLKNSTHGLMAVQIAASEME